MYHRLLRTIELRHSGDENLSFMLSIRLCNVDLSWWRKFVERILEIFYVWDRDLLRQDNAHIAIPITTKLSSIAYQNTFLSNPSAFFIALDILWNAHEVVALTTEKPLFSLVWNLFWTYWRFDNFRASTILTSFDSSLCPSTFRLIEKYSPLTLTCDPRPSLLALVAPSLVRSQP